jgi:hypothetical protein
LRNYLFYWELINKNFNENKMNILRLIFIEVVMYQEANIW